MNVTKAHHKSLNKLVRKHGTRNEILALQSLRGTTGHLNRTNQSLADQLKNARDAGEQLVNQLETIKAERPVSDLKPVVIRAPGRASITAFATESNFLPLHRFANAAALAHMGEANWEKRMFNLVGTDGIDSATSEIEKLKRQASNAKQVPLRAASVIATFLATRGDHFGLDENQAFEMGLEIAKEMAYAFRSDD